MKKHLISILFALVFGILFFCVSASATEAEPTKAEKWYNEAHAVTGMVIDQTTTISGASSSTVRSSLKDGKEAAEIEINGNTIRLISDGKDLILINPDFSLFHVKFPGMAETLLGLLSVEVPTEFSLDFVKSYEHTEGDKTYYIEEFTDANGTEYKYYFLDDNLILIDFVVSASGETVSSRIMIVSYEVDDKIFEIPWYSINIYPIVMLLTLFSLI